MWLRELMAAHRLSVGGWTLQACVGGRSQKDGVVRRRLPTTRHDWPGVKSYKGHMDRSLPSDYSTDSSSLPPSSQIQQITEKEGQGPGARVVYTGNLVSEERTKVSANRTRFGHLWRFIYLFPFHLLH